MRRSTIINNTPVTVKTGHEYMNPVPTRIGRPGTMLGVLWHMITGKEVRRPPVIPGPFVSDPFMKAPAPPEGLRVAWMGHSSVLIDIEGRRFLTDPVWSRRASPFKNMGPERFFEPPVALGDLPRLDGIIISHDHYDHLDESTIRKLAPRGTMFYVSEGIGAYLREWGVAPDRIREMRWWEEVDAGGVTIAATPSRHFSGRSAFRRNRTLWSSWVIKGRQHRVFYSGDTGLFDGLKAIGEAYGPFDITMLEIGAYHPNWGSIHLGPENAVKAHGMLRGRVLMPVHWGTFQLALHNWDDPVRQLIAYAGREGISLCLPMPGAVYSAPALAVNSGWWLQGAGVRGSANEELRTGTLMPVSTDR